jgi:hypothetical protein
MTHPENQSPSYSDSRRATRLAELATTQVRSSSFLKTEAESYSEPDMHLEALRCEELLAKSLYEQALYEQASRSTPRSSVAR